jgi:hypothetical protein
MAKRGGPNINSITRGEEKTSDNKEIPHQIKIQNIVPKTSCEK